VQGANRELTDRSATCSVCFYFDKHHLDETTEKLIKDMFACLNAPTFTWQGGKPTVMGLEFFQKVVAIQQLHLSHI
jgi:uncharacterized protein